MRAPLTFVLLTLLEVCWPRAPGSLCDDDDKWTRVWGDEFDTFDRSIWTVPLGVNNSFGRAANVTEEDTYVEDGKLVLRSREVVAGRSWATGAAISNHRSYTHNVSGISWQYGRFCVRAQLPGAGPGRSQGLWPAHWMMPVNHSRHCGYNEIDILEMINGDGTAWGTYWYWGTGGGGPAGSNCSGAHKPTRAGPSAGVKVPDYHSSYHEYAIEWTPTALTFFVDSTPYLSFSNPAQLPVNAHYIMLNSAVGGSWPGPPNASTVFPAYHKIDYVRVSQRHTS